MQEPVHLKVFEKLCEVPHADLGSNWDTPQIQTPNEIVIFNEYEGYTYGIQKLSDNAFLLPYTINNANI
jgi:hypothetical protein